MVATVAAAMLDDVCEFIVDCEHKTAPTQSEGYPSIRTPNIGRGRLLLDGVNRVSEETYQLWTQRAVPKAGDIILAREAPIGNVAIVPANLKVCLGQRTVLIRPNKLIVDPQYLVYLLLGDEMQGRIQSLSNGATVHHLNLSDIHSLSLPELPPLPTQRKIAAVLSAYDDLIENNTRRIALLEELARALYREWFVEFRYPGHASVPLVESPLGPIPQGWQVAKLGDIAHEVRHGIDPEEVDPETPYIGLEHLPRRSIAADEWSQASEVQSTKLIFHKGDILFGKIRPYFHKVAVAPVDGVCSTDAIVITPENSALFALTLACVSSDEFVQHAVQTSQGTKMPRANWDILTQYPVIVPSSEVLQRFSEIVEEMVAAIQEMIMRNRNLRATRDLLLPKLVSGEVNVAGVEIEAPEEAEG